MLLFGPTSAAVPDVSLCFCTIFYTLEFGHHKSLEGAFGRNSLEGILRE
jgi:hypothetical protein